jgi:hypothetical protein
LAVLLLDESEAGVSNGASSEALFNFGCDPSRRDCRFSPANSAEQVRTGRILRFLPVASKKRGLDADFFSAVL